ncbi:MAG TPA: PIG-L family deacetylase [bacterium]|nr:PIG-L family deacetylase [bacterium]HOL35028.1 PIG-L family deacetylase [bacterium]HPP08630.1 PIG-L family deacetylase [bacterium]
MKVLAISAHPDDIELFCAGTLAKFKKQGHSIAMAILCDGNKGHFEIGPEELAEIRKKEAENSARILGAELFIGLFPDLQLHVNQQAVEKVMDVIRQVDPDVIITHSPDDYMMDHVNAGKLAIDASFCATLPNYRTKINKITKLIPVFFMDTASGVNFQPTEYVDITDEMPIKEKMLLCHQSQYKWLKEHDGIDYVEFMKGLSQIRGTQCGVKYAEGFRQYLAWGRIKPYRILP